MCLKPPLVLHFDLAFGWKYNNSTLIAVEIPPHLLNISSIKPITKVSIFIAFPILNSKLHWLTPVLDLTICFFNLFLNVIKWVGCIFKGFILWILLQLVAFECQEYTLNIRKITSVCRSYPWGSHYWNLSLSYPFPFPSTFPIVFQPV